MAVQMEPLSAASTAELLVASKVASMADLKAVRSAVLWALPMVVLSVAEMVATREHALAARSAGTRAEKMAARMAEMKADRLGAC